MPDITQNKFAHMTDMEVKHLKDECNDELYRRMQKAFDVRNLTQNECLEMLKALTK